MPGDWTPEAVKMLQGEFLEQRKITRALIGVLRDVHESLEGLRLEMRHERTARDARDRIDVLDAVTAVGTVEADEEQTPVEMPIEMKGRKL